MKALFEVYTKICPRELAELCVVNLNTRSHSGSNYARLDVLTLSSCGLSLDDSSDESVEVLDKTNIIHCPIGKASFGAEKLSENFNALVGAIIKAKPAAAKGQYIKSCVIASTMGPGIKINYAKLG